MPNYRYSARNDKGRTVRGAAVAPSQDALYAQLRTEGLFLLDAKETGAAKPSGRALKAAQVADYCRSLGTLLTAGVPLVRAFAILSEEEGLDAQVRRVYDAVRADLRKGIPLSDAMQAQSPAFPPLLVGMIRSAEGTGSIDKSCMRMANHYEREHKLNQEVGNSMMYPAILAVLVVAVVIILMTFVVPQFSDMFAEMESLPLPTVILLGMSDFISNHWLVLAIGAVCAVVVLRCLLLIPAVRLQIDRFKLHAPVIGKLNRRICTARFARTLSNLYSSGVPIVAALQAGQDTVGNTWVAGQFPEVLTTVRAGNSLSDALRQVDGFERKLASAVQVGEETGKLDDMLASISDTMDYEAEMATKKLMTLIEPVMIVMMAVLVGFIVIAVILPIYLSYGTIGGA